jgi:hypothetical protein
MKAPRFATFRPSGPFWFLLAAFGLVLFFFRQPLFTPGAFLWGPDSGSTAFDPLRRAGWMSFLGTWVEDGLGNAAVGYQLNPYSLLSFLPPAASTQAWVYVAAVFGAVVAGLYFLAGRGVRGWPAYTGALALAFSPHTFTIISAGHMGKTEAWPFVILLLAAVDRAILRRSWFHFALAGFAAGTALSVQADMAMLFLYLAAAYGLFLFVRTWPRAQPPPGAETADGPGLTALRLRHVGRNALGALLAGAFVCCVSVGPASWIVTRSLPERRALAHAVSASPEAKASEWEFATNWSLPPEEFLEFVAPGVYGWQTGDPKLPYWGRTGRALGWDQHHRGLMSLRQNAHYLGLLGWIFGLYAVAWAAGRRRRTDAAPAQLLPAESVLPERRSDILFWAGVAVVAVLLALGRNFVLYRLFYEVVPFGSSLRAPVKFLHYAEAALGILLAFGLERLFREMAAAKAARAAADTVAEQTGRKARKAAAAPAQPALPGPRSWVRFAIGCGAIGLLLLLASGIVPDFEPRLRAVWDGQGLSSIAATLLRGTVWALTRGGLLFLGVAAVFACVRWLPASKLMAGSVRLALLGLLAADLLTVDKHYVRVWDEYTRYTPRQMIGRLQSEMGSYRAALPVPGGFYELWKTRLLPRHNIAMTEFDFSGSLYPESRAFSEQLRGNPVRFWQLTSTREIIGPAQSLAPLTNAPYVQVAASFDVLNDGSVRWAPGGEGGQVWLRLHAALPRATLYAAWETVPGESWTNRIADPAWNPATSVLVSDGPPPPGGVAAAPAAPATIVSHRPNRVVVRTAGAAAAILLLNDQFDPGWEVFVDGRRARLLRCNGVMRGVEVPAGSHEVEFLYRPNGLLFALSLLALLTILAWGGGRLLRGSP